jgi:hypothetical protein
MFRPYLTVTILNEEYLECHYRIKPYCEIIIDIGIKNCSLNHLSAIIFFKNLMGEFHVGLDAVVGMASVKHQH